MKRSKAKKSPKKKHVRSVKKDTSQTLSSETTSTNSVTPARSGRKRKKWNLRSKLIPMIRRLWLYSPLRRDVLKAANGQCSQCKTLTTQLSIDHILPIIPVTGWIGWDSYVSHTFCDPSNLQALCSPCHQLKTKEEQNLRRLYKNLTVVE